MSETFRSVNATVIAKAFAQAHYYSGVAITAKDQFRFRKLARMIWAACEGKETKMPQILPDNLKKLVEEDHQ
jgi:hypothetical protein